MSTVFDGSSGLVFDIQRFSIHDGPGIRTNIFLKGCPLRCVWCHNPESYERVPDLFYDEKKCIACGACVPVCPEKCHQIAASGHEIDRTCCEHCGLCAAACPANALELCGKSMTVEEVLRAVMADKPFYREDGGMTLSGGEPMAQPAFALALLKGAKNLGLSTCIETSGYCSQEDLAKVLPFTDLFLYDCKETDVQRHKAYTGVSPQRILQNLRFLSDQGAKLILRCPLIPGFNAREEHLAAVAELANHLPGLLEVQIEPYHQLGTFKSSRLGKANCAEIEPPSAEQIDTWLCFLRQRTDCPVKRA